ncbi:MAG: non-canonical purine NTP pyrophosphatase [Chloroflexota bacterium]
MSTPTPRLFIATTSGGKIRELKQLLADLPVTLVVPADLGIDLDVAEGTRSFGENAAIKARAYHAASGLLTLSEDSGFQVDALGGEPGVVSARWGDTEDYGIKNRLILEKLGGVAGAARRCAYVSSIAIIDRFGRLYRRWSRCEGVVAAEPRGTGGFGFDPIFLVPSLGKTMAEMSTDEKGALSHRGRAVRNAMPLLRTLVEAARRTDN